MQEILYIDMDGVLVDFASAYPKIDPAVRESFLGREDEIPGIFSLMDPMPGALEAFALLSDRYDTYILSTAPWNNPSAWSAKVEWVKEHLGSRATKRLILTHHKNLNRGDLLIDDRDRNGTAEFTGRHIHFGTAAFPDWKAVIRDLVP